MIDQVMSQRRMRGVEHSRFLSRENLEGDSMPPNRPGKFGQ